MVMPSLKRILLVDDDEDIRQLATVILQETGGLTVEAVESGEEALRRIGAFDPDLVLLDMNMPGLDGQQTLERIRSIANFSDLPCIFLTANVRPEETQTVTALDRVAIINKPFDPMSLPENILAVWERWHD